MQSILFVQCPAKGDAVCEAQDIRQNGNHDVEGQGQHLSNDGVGCEACVRKLSRQGCDGESDGSQSNDERYADGDVDAFPGPVADIMCRSFFGDIMCGSFFIEVIVHGEESYCWSLASRAMFLWTQ